MIKDEISYLSKGSIYGLDFGGRVREWDGKMREIKRKGKNAQMWFDRGVHPQPRPFLLPAGSAMLDMNSAVRFDFTEGVNHHIPILHIDKHSFDEETDTLYLAIRTP